MEIEFQFVEFDPESQPLNLTERDHLRYAFLNANRAYDPESTLLVRVGECQRPPNDPMPEAVMAARAIADAGAGIPNLCLSGGIDSEAMARAFVRAGVDFRAIVLRFKNGLNEFDIRHALDYCSANRISVEIVDLDVMEFFRRDRHVDACLRYRNRSPMFAVHFDLLDRIDGLPIMPWQPLHLFRDSLGRIVFGLPEDHYFTYARYFAYHRRKGVPYFFLYTPELIFSFLRTSVMQSAIFGGLRMDPYDLKVRTYSEGGFDIERREQKFTGFEQVKATFQELFKSIGPVFDDLYRRPWERKFPFPKNVDYLFPTSFLKCKGSTHAP